jgi:hypothetical protein
LFIYWMLDLDVLYKKKKKVAWVRVEW